MSDITQSLAEIVGASYVSDQPEEAYFYARDPGLMPTHEPDYVVIPKTVEEIQKIVRLANREKIPIVPMGAGMALTGLVIPLKGGIVVDMKRMTGIIEVNEKARLVIVEGGTSQGLLRAYLEKNYPRLRHSIPDSPATATIAANVMIQARAGCHNSMASIPTWSRAWKSCCLQANSARSARARYLRTGFQKGPPCPTCPGCSWGGSGRRAS